MGHGIALTLARAGHQVFISDPVAEAHAALPARVADSLGLKDAAGNPAETASLITQAPAGYEFGSAALKCGRTDDFGSGAMNDHRTFKRTIVTPRWRSSWSVLAGSCSRSSTWDTRRVAVSLRASRDSSQDTAGMTRVPGYPAAAARAARMSGVTATDGDSSRTF